MSKALALAAAEWERLARILGMLGSDHPGERTAAGHKADEFIRSRQLTWFDVVGLLPATTVRPQQVEPPPRRISPQAALWAVRHDLGALTSWKRSFCESCAGLRKLSPKQRDALRRVILKVAAAAA